MVLEYQKDAWYHNTGLDNVDTHIHGKCRSVIKASLNGHCQVKGLNGVGTRKWYVLNEEYNEGW